MTTGNSDFRRRADYPEPFLNFADSISTNFRQQVDAQPEDQLKAPVGELLRAFGQILGLQVNWRTEVRADDVHGRPDIGITRGQLLIGHIELKRPGMGAQPEYFTGANKTQWNRFKALPNLIYTDGSEWSLYRSGELRQRVRIAPDITAGRKEIELTSLSLAAGLLNDFLYWDPVVPGTSEGLAGFLAPLARILRDEVQSALGTEGSPLRPLADEWCGLLFPMGGDDQFADAYAQTLTYALLLARFEGAENLRPAAASEALQGGHALLADALKLMEVQSVRDQLLMPIQLLERAIGAVDPANIHYGGDPWLYFYEHFLGAYDPELRRDRGVYFTPVEVVRAQVRLAGELLRTRFKKRLAFADDDVVVLDPAAGTGTYPLAVLDHADEAVRDRLGPGAVAGKLRSLAERLHAFEILVGPYSVAHLRMSRRLKDAGVNDRPAKVYLTDTLESPNQPPEFRASLLQERLTQERKRALDVKKDLRVFVCLGNPPYDREQHDPGDDEGRRKGGWVRYGDEGQGEPPILEDFLAPVREAGQGGHLKNLYNDYVYFWRWALWKVLDSTGDAGIVTFITASSYLHGPGFAGMRRKMREVFDDLWIIDLEGDSLGARKTDNVFAIRTPVAIAIGVRDGQPNPDTPATVRKTRLRGPEQSKLAILDNAASFSDLNWRTCAEEWDAPFYPAGTGTYFDWPAVTDVFPWQHSGVQLKRKWPIGETADVLQVRWQSMLGRTPSQRQVAFRETSDRKIANRYPTLSGIGDRGPAIAALTPNSPAPPIAPYAYRSFDRQWVFEDSRLGDRIRPELWRSHGEKQVYVTSLLTAVLGTGPAAVASAAVPDLDHFRGSFGGKHVIPLWRDTDATRPNVTDGLLEALGSFHKTIHPTPGNLFAYAYGILAQPSYVELFWEELEMPPPRLPITKDVDLFNRVTAHGERLLYLHTYGERFAGPDEDGSVPHGVARCTLEVSSDQYPETFKYDPVTQVLWVGEGRFTPVSPEVWNYSVSGLQIVKSWLDKRKLKRSGRISSPLDNIRPERWDFTEELLELLWVLEETVRLQPDGAALLEELCASNLFSRDELPIPGDEERQPPRQTQAKAGQAEFSSSESH